MRKLDCQDYSIIFGSSPNVLADFLKDKSYTQLFVLVDENTAKYCLSKLTEVLSRYESHIIKISSGEDSKNLETCQEIFSQLLDANADRHALLINLGGGVIGDMGGFCASTFMRGIDFIQIPTTLLSQVDSSVGGKLGVDFNMVKNIIGVFNNPELVIIDRDMLGTLPQGELRSGFAEMVKHGLISDKSLFEELSVKDFGLEPKNFINDLLYRSVLVKKRVVEEDPYEKGLRKILNYGHTVGHAIETASWKLDKPLLHGEAIFIGMVCENYIAYTKNMISEELMKKINAVLTSIFYRADAIKDEKAILEHMRKDKKNQNKKIFAALINGIGNAIPATEISEEEVLGSLSYYKNI
jgi:3-dehydroquinate synthase